MKLDLPSFSSTPVPENAAGLYFTWEHLQGELQATTTDKGELSLLFSRNAYPEEEALPEQPGVMSPMWREGNRVFVAL